MKDKYSQLEAVLHRRKALAEKFRVQHKTLHEDRNRTAGEIYENTKDLERMAAEFVDVARHEDYAQSWMERWPRQ